MVSVPHMIAHWELEGDKTLNGGLVWVPLDREVLPVETYAGYNMFSRIYAAMERYVAEGEVTEILEVNHYALPTDSLVARVHWWAEQLALRNKEQDDAG